MKDDFLFFYRYFPIKKEMKKDRNDKDNEEGKGTAASSV